MLVSLAQICYQLGYSSFHSFFSPEVLQSNNEKSGFHYSASILMVFQFQYISIIVAELWTWIPVENHYIN